MRVRSVVEGSRLLDDEEMVSIDICTALDMLH